MPRPKILLYQDRGYYSEVMGDEGESFDHLIRRSHLLLGNVGIRAGMDLEMQVEPKIQPKAEASLILPYALCFMEDRGKLQLHGIRYVKRKRGEFTTHLVNQSTPF